jgi:hypothetical protein
MLAENTASACVQVSAVPPGGPERGPRGIARGAEGAGGAWPPE